MKKNAFTDRRRYDDAMSGASVIALWIRLALWLTLLALLCVSAGAQVPAISKLTYGSGLPDQFGASVALSGNTLVVGANTTNSGAGAVYVYSLSGSVWNYVTTLTANDSQPGDNFGSSIAVSSNTIVIGANGNSHTGAVYIFTLTGTPSTWTQTAKLVAPDGQPGDSLGAVSISGSTLVVGAGNRNNTTGAAYVWTGSGRNWTFRTELTANDAQQGDQFGGTVGVSGNTIVCGAFRKNSYTGAVYVFSPVGNSWAQKQKLVASDGQHNGLFGRAVALSGSYLVVGAGGTNAGEAYVFQLSLGVWHQIEAIIPADALPGYNFGTSVAISGTTIAVGAVQGGQAGIVGSGAVYLYTIGSLGVVKLMAFDGIPGDGLGYSVALSGKIVASGAVGADGCVGAVYASP